MFYKTKEIVVSLSPDEIEEKLLRLKRKSPFFQRIETDRFRIRINSNRNLCASFMLFLFVLLTFAEAVSQTNMSEERLLKAFEEETVICHGDKSLQKNIFFTAVSLTETA